MASNQEQSVITKRRLEIAKRRGEIAQQMASLNNENNTLAKEDDELVVAQRVISRLMNVPEPSIETPETAAAPATGGKPAGTPTVYEMAIMILQEAEQAGKAELEGREIFERIKSRWWGSAHKNDIVPTLWRLAKTKRLKKKGSKYSRATSVRDLEKMPEGKAAIQ